MKEEIVKVSLQQFLLKGIRKMTVKDIIAPLGISTKTVYKYFANKEALLEACLDLHYSDMPAGLEQISHEFTNPVIRIFRLFIKGIELDFKVNEVFYHDLNYYYPELQDKVMSKNGAAISGVLKNAFRDGKEQGYIRDAVNTDVILEGLGVLYRSLTRTGQFDKLKLSPFELAANTLEVYLRGTCTEKGLFEIDNNPALTSFNFKPKS